VTKKFHSVVEVVAGMCGVTVDELAGKDRHRSIATCRKVAMYVVRCHVRPVPSYPEIARAFGNRDHTTVMSAVSSIERLRGQDEWVEALIATGRREAERLTREWKTELAACGYPMPEPVAHVGAAE
jgi:chromosomal replication initiation ATPase DnaA